MKKLINEAFRMQQLAGIKPLYENYYGDSYGTNYSGATAGVDVYLADIEINGVMYAEIELTLNAKSTDDSGQSADWEIRSVDGATLENGEKINDREQLQALIPSILQSEEANSQIQNSLDSGFDWDDE